MSRNKKRSTIEWIIETIIYLYIMYALLWSICKIVGEIFVKMGVA